MNKFVAGVVGALGMLVAASGTASAAPSASYPALLSPPADVQQAQVILPGGVRPGYYGPRIGRGYDRRGYGGGYRGYRRGGYGYGYGRGYRGGRHGYYR